MAGVEEQAGEHLVRLVAQARLEVVAHRLRAFQRRVALDPRGQVAAAHLQHRLQLGVLGRPQAQMGAEARQFGFQQLAQAAELGQQMARQIHRAAPGHAGAQEDRQQLGIAQRRRPLGQQFFPRPFLLRPVANAHGQPPCLAMARPHGTPLPFILADRAARCRTPGAVLS
ncbi:hypothetical protein D3C78_1000080 [compost metagenome]